jgi:hypothetical protein
MLLQLGVGHSYVHILLSRQIMVLEEVVEEVVEGE